MAEYDEIRDARVVDEAGRKGGAVAAPAWRGPAALTRAEAGEAVYLGISRASWPAIWAGFFISAITYVLLNTLGVALGFTWLNYDQVTQNTLSTAAGIWLILTSLISFFVGGCVTGMMSSIPGRNTGFMNGILFGAFALVLFAVLTIIPAASGLPSLTRLWAQMGAPTTMGQSAVSTAQSVAWWSFFGIILTLLAAGFGGVVGARRAPVDPLNTTGDETTA